MDKDPNLIIHTTNPVNAEPPLSKLRENFITPYEEFYIRNHGEIPEIDVSAFRLKINGMVNHELEFTMESLRNNFTRRTVMATLQCAGNRRTELISVAPIPGEVPWKEGAIGNTYWTGVPLNEILRACGVSPAARYIEFIGADEVFRHGENVGFGASISIEKAMSEEVLLAYEMDGKPLPPTHGFPLRAVVPGYIGARSVKWLNQITLQAEPSKNYFQDHAYRLFPPEADADTVDWNSGVQLSELNVNCAITSPLNNAELDNGKITVQGWAIGNGGKEILRVEVSTNSGQTWTIASLSQGGERYAWTFWETKLKLENGAHEIIARAIDMELNTQPEDLKDVWNFKGYMNNAWHRVKITVKANG
ncbi:MAG: molybdopterin-dependent oxidoreductase [Chitinophagales bacterium]|nr:molybdopterin-dependent oxidoreductase [Chitinophagales bacterium]